MWAQSWYPSVQLNPSPRARWRQGLLVHVLEVLDDDVGVEFGRHHCNLRWSGQVRSGQVRSGLLRGRSLGP